MNFLIYGAYGYTGELISRLAKEKGYKPTLAGRNPEKTKKLAEALNLPFEVFSLNETQLLEKVLSRHDLVLHIAGPYSHTAEIMVNACLKTKTHYLDVTGELEVFEWIATQDKKAKEAGIVLLPGTGFDVVPSDCLARYLYEKLPDANSLELAWQGVGKFSRGTALTMAENLHKGGSIRENGAIKLVPPAYQVKEIFINGKNRLGATIPWGDVSTAFYSTGIPNIKVFMIAPKNLIKNMKRMRYLRWFFGIGFVKKQMQAKIRNKVTGPDEQMRKTSRSYFWGQVENAHGQKVAARLETPEGYTLTAITALKSAEKLMESKLAPGFYTPSKAFGKDFILKVDSVVREDV
ncbi:saccharopine dehydrogenase family protein [Flexithrix dorotheae]|uniref:saccharopine dehydrogenase family protein n=1 Tax=Flexithrix dorotheae TaxID=70993 RepID=UPI00036A1B34|nr:saccharopine dehydrogenase NADP-binding domain-containing protein [Flexithrix dorotheae]